MTELLFEKLGLLKGKEDEKSRLEVKAVEEAIAKETEKKYNLLMTELDTLKPDKGRIDAQIFWQINKKLFPRSKDTPTSIYNKKKRKYTYDKQGHRRKSD